MDARKYYDLLDDDLIWLAHYDGDDEFDGHGPAVIINHEHCIAVMLRPCGDLNDTGVGAGAIVKFLRRPGADPKIVGEPAGPP